MKAEQKQLTVPKMGWQKELARLAGCTPQTVCSALHHNATGRKADLVRRLYQEKYGNNQ
jgi:hypothetical protein